MRFWKPAAVLSLLSAVVFLAVVPAANAMHETDPARFGEAAQTLTTPVSGNPPDASRDEYTVTVEPVISWPSSDHDITPGQGNFGIRHCRGCSLDHHGVDFNPGGGAPIYVVTDGVVTDAACADSLGCHVEVYHPSLGISTVYGHMQRGSITVSLGDSVNRLTVLGLCGSTGMSTGNHLHFEVRIGGVPIDGYAWLVSNVNDQDWAWMQ